MKFHKLTYLFLVAAALHFQSGFALNQATHVNHIGLSYDRIKEMMAKQESDFYFNRELKLKKARIIKYVDEEETKTLIYVFDKKDLCKYYIIIYDYMYLDEVIKNLDKNCEKQGDDSWIEVNGGERYNKFLEKSDWFFTVITQKTEID